MTWKEFKDAVEKQGVVDTDLIWYIDFMRRESCSDTVLIYKDEVDGVTITDIEESYLDV
jgi:hypothetical protein